MTIKVLLGFIRRIVYLTCAMMFCYAAGIFGSGLANLSALAPAAGGTSVSPWSAFIPVLLFSFAVALLFAYIIFRSYWHGLKLALALFVAFYGLMTIVLQVESLLFLRDQIADQILARIFLSGLITAGLFAPLAILVMGRAKPQEMLLVFKPHLEMSLSEWLGKIVIIGCVYLALYNIFGYFVAWKNPAVQLYYGGHDPGNFFAHVANQWSRQPIFFLFQFGRGLLWILFALPIIRMHKGGTLEVGFTIALLFAVWSLQLLIPNPLMPPDVARVHLIEMASSNFIFGWIVGILLA
jgi:hypothetical protein